MAVTLIQGLADLSTELGETTTIQTTPRITAYNDAVVEFFNEKKFPFARKNNIQLTTVSGTQTYTLLITDLRTPGGIRKITIGTTLYLPIEEENATDADYENGTFFYYSQEDNTITFTGDITTTGSVIKINYYAIPSRQTNVTTGTFAMLPDRYRKAIAYLAGSYILRSRHMNGEAKDRLILYQQAIQNVGLQQSETITKLPRKFGYRPNFRRVYR